jgi:hypothetical protein
VIGAAVMVGKIATGEIVEVEEKLSAAMAAGLTDKLMDMSDIVGIIDLAEDRRRQEAISSQVRARP